MAEGEDGPGPWDCGTARIAAVVGADHSHAAFYAGDPEDADAIARFAAAFAAGPAALLERSEHF